jgi:nitrite reductase (NADH) small subunit/3-phenylpropionate/trans-cinnamate dioxygenase ferredoxin subunit
MPAYVRVAKSNEIQPGTTKRIEAGDKVIALFNLDGVFHAIDDTCTHRGGPLSEGMLVGNEVTCPWHGAIFDVTTGEVISPPAPLRVAIYRVRIAGDDVEVEI